MKSFQQRLEAFGEHLEHARVALAHFGLAGRLDDIEAAAAREEFRVAVLGRFKAGKSTLVNALLGEKVAPTGTLPCTSGVVEFVVGRQRRYERWDQGSSGQTSRKEFEAAVGSAVRAHGAGGRWRVRLPAPWLGPGLVLVDTPGTDEDSREIGIQCRSPGVVRFSAHALVRERAGASPSAVPGSRGCVAGRIRRPDRVMPTSSGQTGALVVLERLRCRSAA